MKKLILPLLLLTVISSEANAKGIAGQIKSIFCDFRGSQSVFSIQKKTITHYGRTEDTVKPILDLQIDNEADTITVTSKQFGQDFKDVFKVAGLPYQPGLDPNTIQVSVTLGNNDCTGRIK